MKFPRLTIENFLSIETATLNLADRGLVAVYGVNEDNTSADSNGAGKSSIADALYWCLTGTTARGLEGDKVVNRQTGKGTLVELEVQDGLDTFIIRRHRKHKTGKNALHVFQVDGITGGHTDLTKGTDKLTQAVVFQILGCSDDVFRAAAYAAQGKMPDLPGMTDKQLKMMVEEAAGVTVLEAAYKEASTRLSTAKATMISDQAMVDRSDQMIQVRQDALNSAETSHDTHEITRKTAIDAMKVQALDHGANAKHLAMIVASGGKPRILAEIVKATDDINGVAGQRQEEVRLTGNVNSENRKLATISAAAKMAMNLVESAKKSLADIEKIVGTPCGECGKQYGTHDVDAARQLAQQKLDTQMIALKGHQKNTQTALQSLKDAQGQLSNHQSVMTDVSGVTGALASLNISLREIQIKESEQAAAVKSARDAIARLGVMRAEPNPFARQIIATLAARDAETLHNLTRRASLNVAREALTRAEIVAKVFAPAGVRAHILDDVTPFLNDQTAKYLSVLTDGNTTANWTTLIKNAKGELRENFSIEVADAQGGDTFTALSGGEQRKVRIAASLALQDLVARRATKPLEIFIGDEIDDAIDPAGIERLAIILEEKARERGTVMIISHGDLRDWISNTITVTKKDHKSTIEESVS